MYLTSNETVPAADEPENLVNHHIVDDFDLGVDEADQDDDQDDDQVDEVDGEYVQQGLELEICLMNQVIEETGLDLSEILPLIAWVRAQDEDGILMPCLDCLEYGFTDAREGQGLGRCFEHIDHCNEEYFQELERELIPSYLELLGEV